ncbi:autotransporter domain-containing protein [Microvirga alba]|uniref:Autotransporter domain-containing protein n=1 Tax=Microvirga alba TaxID=2791025 RepID=A0A931BR69_9HYPH|nr:autotransporter domain-containing protein [Microvirga alba]MBF9233264.1 autotransporter domain-containing protein [Microvirga alba]
MLRGRKDKKHRCAARSVRLNFLSAISANVFVLTYPSYAQAQQIDAGSGETKSVPASVTTNSQPALRAHDGGQVQGGPSVITTTGDYAHGALAEQAGAIDLAFGSINTVGRSALGLYAFGAGSSVTSSTDATTTGDEAHAVFARAGGIVNLTGGLLRTSGSSAYGLLADGNDSKIDSRAIIMVSGPNANGAAATNGGVIVLNGGTINVSGIAGYGLYAFGIGSSIRSAINVTTTADYSHGAFAQGGGALNLMAGTISTSGASAAGLLSEGIGTRITSSADTFTSGADSVGVLARFSGFTEQAGGLISTSGARSHGLLSTGAGSQIKSAGSVRTSGNDAAGAFADAGGSVILRDASVTTSGASAAGLLSNGTRSSITGRANVSTSGQASYGAQAVNAGFVSLTGGTIATAGAYAQGIRSIGNDSVVESAAQVTTSGQGAAGIAALSGGTVRLLGGSVETSGTGEAIYAFGLGSLVTGRTDAATKADGIAAALADGRGTISLIGGAIKTSGVQAPGLAATYGGALSASNVSVTTTGAGSAGMYVTAASLELEGSRINSSGAGVKTIGNASVAIGNSSVTSGASMFDAAFDLAGQRATFDIRGSNLLGVGSLLNVARGDNGQDGIVTLTLDGSEATGNLLDRETRTSGYTSVVLRGGSRLTGGLDGIQRLTLDLGTWSLAGPVNVSLVEVGPSGGTLDTPNPTISLSAPLTGSGALKKTGIGLLDLTGFSSLSGPTFVQAGQLAVNGSLANSAVTVAGGAVLSGSGTIGGLTAQSGSMIAPGNASIGTLHVAGNVRFLQGSVYAFEANAAGQSDRIAATGQAILSGGIVNVLPDRGAIFRADSPYFILTASGGVSGTFEGTSSADFAFVTPTLGYTEDAVTLTLRRKADSFSSAALTRNQYRTAAGIEALGAGNRLYDTVLGSSLPGARLAFDALSGEAHASAVTSAYGDARLMQNAILSRLRQPLYGNPARFVQGFYGETFAADRPWMGAYPVAVVVPVVDPNRFDIWGEGFGSWSRTRGNGNAATLEESTGGFVLGADATLNQKYRIGFAGGLTRTSFDVDGRLSSGANESIFGALYGSTQWRAVNLRLGASYAGHDIDTQRTITFPGFSDQTSASYDGSTVQAFGEVGYRFDVARMQIEPFLGASVLRLHTNRFVENGGDAALTGLARDYDLATTTMGVRAEARLDKSLPLALRGLVGWRRAYGDVEPDALLAFAGGASAFAVSGTPIDRNALVAEAELNWQAGRTTSLGMAYSGQIGPRAQDHGLKANFTSRF